MSNSEIISALTELQEYNRIIEEAQAAADALKDRIKAHMGDSDTLIAGPYKVTWKAVTTSRIDSKALAKDYPEIASEYTKTSTSRRFLVA